MPSFISGGGTSPIRVKKFRPDAGPPVPRNTFRPPLRHGIAAAFPRFYFFEGAGLPQPVLSDFTVEALFPLRFL